MPRPLLYTHKSWADYSSHNPSQHMAWDVRRCDHGDPHPAPPRDSVVFYTDSELEHAVRHDVAVKTALLLETRFVNWWVYDFLEGMIDEFDRVLTFDRDLLERFPDRCVFYPHGGCTIDRRDFAMYDKSKLVSFLASDKKLGPPGHSFRHEFVGVYNGRDSGWQRRFLGDVAVDLHGSIVGDHLPSKLPTLRDYMFQIVVENNISDVYFTEKIIDCFVTGVVPIYRGTRRIEDHFDMGGVIQFESIEELCRILADLSPDDYEARMAAARRNFELSQPYVLVEDWLWHHTDVFAGSSRD